MRISDWSSDVCSSDLDTEPAKSREGTSVLQKNWTELIKPTKLDIQPGPDAHRVAKVVAEPLARGFGLTLGNAIRRVLLSSLQGAAATSMQVAGVLHEFYSIPGVRQDVPDVVTNQHAIALRLGGGRRTQHPRLTGER